LPDWGSSASCATTERDTTLIELVWLLNQTREKLETPVRKGLA
jgi:hypothetical protein